MNAEFTREVMPIGRLLWLLGAYRVHRDGGGLVPVWRWWHPLAWLTWLIMLQVCGVVGEKVNDAVPFRLSPYWRERRDQIEWVSWFGEDTSHRRR